MNYNEIDRLLGEIVNVQKNLAASSPALPKDSLYIFSRILFYGMIISGIVIYEIDYQKKVKISAKTRSFYEVFQTYLCIYGISLIISFFANFFINRIFDKTQNDYFVAFELLQLEVEKKEYVSKKNRALRNKEEILKKVNLMTKNNPKIEDLENAKKFLEKQINVIWHGKKSYEK